MTSRHNWCGLFASNHMCFAPDTPIIVGESPQGMLFSAVSFFGEDIGGTYNAMYSHYQKKYGLSIRPVIVEVDDEEAQQETSESHSGSSEAA
jgi:hypothetical protein